MIHGSEEERAMVRAMMRLMIVTEGVGGEVCWGG